MNKTTLLFTAIAAIIFSSCKNPKEKLQEEINETEKMLFADSAVNINRTTALKVVDFYTTFANKFPDDAKTPDYLFKAGDVSSGMSEFARALGYFNQVYTKYPNHAKASTSLFLMGFINENSLNDTAAARKYYSTFLEKYPSHEMAQSAAFSLQNMGKSADELVKMFQQSQPDSTATN
ncbi:MAG: tetratricopeptide repeat protein [Bacteroidetes bacterium]|nr:tetratricopeptide repeat protein [Bacteroidota bacterium]HNR21187.1 tetratricopeptide repeat protein [Bacteroidia bacterium]HNU33444.1 tetratricopeptide repeat protein [Bacteroidia bacterium]